MEHFLPIVQIRPSGEEHPELRKVQRGCKREGHSGAQRRNREAQAAAPQWGWRWWRRRGQRRGGGVAGELCRNVDPAGRKTLNGCFLGREIAVEDSGKRLTFFSRSRGRKTSGKMWFALGPDCSTTMFDWLQVLFVGVLPGLALGTPAQSVRCSPLDNLMDFREEEKEGKGFSQSRVEEHGGSPRKSKNLRFGFENFGKFACSSEFRREWTRCCKPRRAAGRRRRSYRSSSRRSGITTLTPPLAR